jgi:adenosylmethionine-8-amino-7-oxononanoate aminotransferase
MSKTPPPGGNVWRPYTQMKLAPPPLEVVATEGVRLILADGRTLIDGTAAWWTAAHGFNHPHIRQAITDQLGRLPHTMFAGLTHAPAETLARRLAALLPGDLDHVFFTDSGSVAVEVAMKMAVQYWINRGLSGRTRFVSFRGGYHGDTLGAMSVTDTQSGMYARLGRRSCNAICRRMRSPRRGWQSCSGNIAAASPR